jgi:hypothetical protein
MNWGINRRERSAIIGKEGKGEGKGKNGRYEFWRGGLSKKSLGVSLSITCRMAWILSLSYLLKLDNFKN